MDVSKMSGGFFALLGLELDEISEDRVTIRWRVRPELHQPYGILHGGVHCAVVETVASLGAGIWLGERGRVVGVSNQTDFLRAVGEGELIAVGTPVHRGAASSCGRWRSPTRTGGWSPVARSAYRTSIRPPADKARRQARPR
ncbi:hypothetical protein GCM10029963_18510 [Micromonospora andamanensis]